MSARRFRRVVPTLLVSALSLAPAVRADVPPALGGFEILLGEWEAFDDPTGASGGFTFARGVQDRVIVRTNYSVAPATAGKPASRHDDLMVIFVDNGAVRADYFDNEGHVIRYSAESRAGTITFVSEFKAGEPRYRLTYERATGGVLTGRFEIATPDAPDGFKPYLSWKARRRR